MARVLALILLLSGTGDAFATGFDYEPCLEYSLSSGQLKQLAKKVRAATGQPLADRDPTVCRLGNNVGVYSNTRRFIEPHDTELWHDVQCDFNRTFSRPWDCRYIPQRIARVRGHWKEGDGEVFIPLTVDGAVVQRRLKEALTLGSTLAESNRCEAEGPAAQQLLELRSDLSAPYYQLQVAMEDDRFTLWTLRYAVHFTAPAPDAELQLKCWRPKKSIHECLSTRCPA